MKTLLFIPFLFMCSMVIGQSSKQIIGTPKIIVTPTGRLEVAQNDFLPMNMNYNDAVKACKALGSGWRLPSKDELHSLFINKDFIGGFERVHYWSSTLVPKKDEYDKSQNLYTMCVTTGVYASTPFYYFTKEVGRVRAVRTNN